MADPQSEIRREEKNDAPETLEKSVTIDTLHNDEAVKVLATYAGDQEWTPEEEKKLVRRIDKRLTSILCATYGLQYYDKAMLSQAVRSSFPFSIHCLLTATRHSSVFEKTWNSASAYVTQCPQLSSTSDSLSARTQQSCSRSDIRSNGSSLALCSSGEHVSPARPLATTGKASTPNGSSLGFWKAESVPALC
jgi:hypothetical protein